LSLTSTWGRYMLKFSFKPLSIRACRELTVVPYMNRKLFTIGVNPVSLFYLQFEWSFPTSTLTRSLCCYIKYLRRQLCSCIVFHLNTIISNSCGDITDNHSTLSPTWNQNWTNLTFINFHVHMSVLKQHPFQAIKLQILHSLHACVPTSFKFGLETSSLWCLPRY